MSALRDAVHPRRALARALPAIGVWLGTAIFLVLIQLGRETPTVFVDEFIYGRLAQNLAHGEGFTIQGVGSSLRTAYPYLIAPAWLLFDHVAAYRTALGINAIVMSAATLPAWALARSITTPRRALLIAAGAGLLPSMVWAGMLMTEAAAYPLAAVALWGAVCALREPRPRWIVLTLIACGMAALVRTQLIALVGVFALAAILDVARHDRGWRSRLRTHRLVVGVAVVLVVAAAAYASRGTQNVLSTYCGTVTNVPSPGQLAGPLKDYVGTFLIATLGLPLVALVTLALRAENRRDPVLGPLLSVAIAATIVLLGEAAWTAAIVSPETQERYVFYAAPAILACAGALPGRVRPRDLLVVGGAFVIYLVVLFPGFADVTGDVVAQRLGLHGLPARFVGNQGLLWGSSVAAIVALAALALRGNGSRQTVLLLLPMVVFGTAILTVRQIDANDASAEAAAKLPAPRAFLDEAGSDPVGVVVMRGADASLLFATQFWNRSADRTYRIGTQDAYGAGQLCPIEVDARGRGYLLAPCAGRGLPRRLLILQGRLRIGLEDARRIPVTTRNASLYELQRGATASTRGMPGSIQIALEALRLTGQPVDSLRLPKPPVGSSACT